jgi:hypothetical protein
MAVHFRSGEHSSLLRKSCGAAPFPAELQNVPEFRAECRVSYPYREEEMSMRYTIVIAAWSALATPAVAEEVGVGVGVGPGGAGVTVGQSRDYDRDRVRERETVVKEREPADRTTVIKKEHDDGTRTKTIVKERE